jgi:DNA-binding Lrp family transcriptional regulator
MGESLKVPMAYVLINTEIGSESEVLDALRKLEGVEEAHNLWGVYDIIASIKADTIDNLTSIISKKIEQIGKVNAKLTMIITETQMAPPLQNAFLFETSTVQS